MCDSSRVTCYVQTYYSLTSLLGKVTLSNTLGTMRRNSSNAAPSTTEPVVSIRDIIPPEQQKTIQKLLADKNGSDSLLELAKQSLSTLSHWDHSDRLLPAPFGTAEEVCHIDSFQLFETMLECASLGGPKHYVAAAIVSCQEELSRYICLANTWFGLFLWQCVPSLFPYYTTFMLSELISSTN